MTSWILIIFMSSPAGDFMDKQTLGFDTQKACEAVRIQLPKLDHPMRVKHEGVCVTRDHWEGRKQMPGMAYD